VKIWPVPVEVEDPIPFEQDRENASMMPNTQIGSGAFWYEQIKYSRVCSRSLANAALCIFTGSLIWQTRFLEDERQREWTQSPAKPTRMK